MAASILVTGATGTVGKELVQRLALIGINVRAALHTPQLNGSSFPEINVETIYMDFDDPESISEALDGIEEIFLLTPATPDQFRFARNVIDMAKKRNVSHIVRLSMFGADRVPMITYTRWHHEIEQYLFQTGISSTVIRPNMYMQDFLHMVRLGDGILYLPLGEGRVSYIDARDVADAAAEILMTGRKHHGKIYELTGPEALDAAGIAAIITKVLGSVVEYADIAEETARHAMESAGKEKWEIDAMLEFYAVNRSNLAAKTTKTFALLTNSMPRAFVDFARDNAEELRKVVAHR